MDPRERQQDWTLAMGYAAATAALVVFAYFANAILRGQAIQFDTAVRNAVHSLASPTLTRFMRGVTWIGSEFVLLPLGALVVMRLLAAHRRHSAILFVIAALGGEGLNQVLKLAFRRPRPEPFFGYQLPTSYSFPSGHSMVSFCFFGALAAILTTRMASRRRQAAIWTVAALLALTIGTSRIYLGVHYPTDVVAGFAVAAIWVAAIRFGYEYWLRRRRLLS